MKRAKLADESELSSRDRLAPPWPGREHLIDGHQLFVRETPATKAGAEPAVYVHGLGGSSQNWTDMADLLSERVEGHAIDLPGFGHSAPTRRYTIPGLAQQVASWITHSGRGPVHLFGNSLGGALSVYVAATRPHLVRSLTLISPAMPFADVRRSVQSRMLPLLALPRADRIAARAMASMTPEQLIDQVAEHCWGEPGSIDNRRREEAIDEIRQRLAVPWNSRAYISAFRALVTTFLKAYIPGSASLWRLAGQITAPTLVIWGKQDKLLDVRMAPQVGRTIEDSRLLILDKVGHVAMMERPIATARAFLGMLNEIQYTHNGGKE